METTTGNPIIQRLQCTGAIHVILVLPTLNVHFVSKTTQVQNATLQATPPREKLYYDPRLNVLFVYVPAIKRVNVNLTTDASNVIQTIIYLFVTFMV